MASLFCTLNSDNIFITLGIPIGMEHWLDSPYTCMSIEQIRCLTTGLWLKWLDEMLQANQFQ